MRSTQNGSTVKILRIHTFGLVRLRDDNDVRPDTLILPYPVSGVKDNGLTYPESHACGRVEQ